MPLHSDLTGSDLHEPKGVDDANEFEVYIADGEGSGAWGLLTPSSLSGTVARVQQLWAVIEDVSAASSVIVPIGQACTITRIVYVLGGAISVADSAVSVVRQNGNSLGTATTIAYSSSAEGNSYEFIPSSNNTFAGTLGQYIKISSDGGSTTSAPLYILVTLTLD